MSDTNGFKIKDGVLLNYRANKAEVEIPDGVEKINDSVNHLTLQQQIS